MQVTQIQIKNIKFNVPLCSAVDQRDIILQLGKYGLEGVISGLALDRKQAGSWERFGVVVVAVLLNKMPQNIATDICDKLLKGAKVHDEQLPQNADLEYFSGHMEDYFELVKEALIHNFKGFFPYLDQIKSSFSGQTESNQVEKKQTSTQQ